MQKRSVMLAFLITSMSSASAQQDFDICKTITSFGTYDANNRFTDQQKLMQAQHTLCSSEFQSHDSARSVSNESGVDFIDFLNLSFGSETTSNNYTERRNEFCEFSYSDMRTSTRLQEAVRRGSDAITRSFNRCISDLANRQGFFGYITQSSNKNAFSVHLSKRDGGSNSFTLEGIDTAPINSLCKLNGENLNFPQNLSGQVTLLCAPDDTDETVLVSVNTSAGDVRGPNGTAVELPGRKDTMSDLVNRITALEGNMIHSSLVAAFDGACPVGWTEYARGKGRFIIGANDEFLARDLGGVRSINVQTGDIGAGLIGSKLHTSGGDRGRYGMSLVLKEDEKEPNERSDPWRVQKAKPIEILPSFVALTLCQRPDRR